MRQELRRINRAWNAKAEGEKKRAEQERRAREVEKQAKTLAMSKSSQPSSAVRGVPMYGQGPYPQQSGPRQIKTQGHGINGVQYAPVMMQQAYFPPLGTEGYPPLGHSQSQRPGQPQMQGRQQQQQLQQQSQQPHMQDKQYEPSISNPELSADGLNRGAREFVPKFANKSQQQQQQQQTVTMPPPPSGFIPPPHPPHPTEQQYLPLGGSETWGLGQMNLTGNATPGSVGVGSGIDGTKWSPSAGRMGSGVVGVTDSSTGDVFDTTIFNEALNGPLPSNSNGQQSSLLGMLNIESTESWASEPSADISSFISGVIDSPGFNSCF